MRFPIKYVLLAIAAISASALPAFAQSVTGNVGSAGVTDGEQAVERRHVDNGAPGTFSIGRLCDHALGSDLASQEYPLQVNRNNVIVVFFREFKDIAGVNDAGVGDRGVNPAGLAERR